MWLGFRGEALASVAEISATLGIVTCVEGEAAAALLRVRKGGDIERQEHVSHPVGTTIRVIDFFKSVPVWKRAALKHSSRYLVNIKHLMQAYALSRPAIKFSLRILKAKDHKSNWMYAPKSGANVEDAAFKVVGRLCASQCKWIVLESNGFKIQAFLPRPNADSSKIGNQGHFISVDSRPVSGNQGTLKEIITLFKEKLRKVNSSLAGVKKPFIFMNVVCPPDSYDPNIEPAKDDVLFDNSGLLLRAVEKFLNAFYSKAHPEMRLVQQSKVFYDDNEEPTSPAQKDHITICEDQIEVIPNPPKRRRTLIKRKMKTHHKLSVVPRCRTLGQSQN
ncbi:ribosomal protein S5 domain 2-like protein [Lepidopterella palustris CBS 459.81]|uniref:Ribosomal protein S5 domain 2-like protein n=1 Tax=Lepidopterella palustris CBS 459.81 TaxID=1314670 RepID=A0A8E2DYX5_9PEZI|nr:ribosomal protein S5 domain 2-like protein [Lepidopterella palustris CBS 459.81]